MRSDGIAGTEQPLGGGDQRLLLQILPRQKRNPMKATSRLSSTTTHWYWMILAAVIGCEGVPSEVSQAPEAAVASAPASDDMGDGIPGSGPAQSSAKYVLDGVPVSRTEVDRMRDRPLVFIFDEDPTAGPVVRVFSKREEADAFEAAHTTSEPDISLPDGTLALTGGQVSLFRDKNLQGWEWAFKPEKGSIPYFTCADPEWQHGCSDLNNEVSSIANLTKYTVILYQFPRMNIHGGAELRVLANQSVPDLGWFEDRASSLNYVF
jgi:hypothetical protein